MPIKIQQITRGITYILWLSACQLIILVYVDPMALNTRTRSKAFIYAVFVQQ